jgi:hypothetical protein
MQTKTKKRTPKKQSSGLGDTIAKITEATGIEALTKFIAGDDCGCDKRKELLNKIFPYKKANCLSEDDFNYLDDFFKNLKNTISIAQQRELTAIYKNIFNIQLQQTSCDSCWRDSISELRKIYNEY